MDISIVSLGAEPVARYVDQVRLAEDLGLHAFFHNDKKWARDVYSRLGAATQVTSRIGLGISVIDPYTRHPALTAQASATLAEMAPGRFRVVMGSGSHFETLPGYGNRKPVRAIREAFDIMRGMWSGKRITVDGEVVQFRDGAMDFVPEAVPEAYIASRGPQILKLAGEIADGVLIGSFATPPGIEYAKRHVEKGLETAGRSWSDLRLCSWLYLSILEKEGDQPPANVRRGVSFALWSSRQIMLDMIDDLTDDVTDEFLDFVRNGPRDWKPETMTELQRLIPPGIFDSLAIVGTADQVVERLRALEAAGVQEAVFWPFPQEGQETEDVIRRLAADVMPRVASS